MVILSPHSMRSKWVKTEIALARRMEQDHKRRVLFPIGVVPSESLREWEQIDPDTGEDVAADIREYLIPDFSRWENPEAYAAELKKLITDLTRLKRPVSHDTRCISANGPRWI